MKSIRMEPGHAQYACTLGHVDGPHVRVARLARALVGQVVREDRDVVHDTLVVGLFDARPNLGGPRRLWRGMLSGMLRVRYNNMLGKVVNTYNTFVTKLDIFI